MPPLGAHKFKELGREDGALVDPLLRFELHGVAVQGGAEQLPSRGILG
ncbi:hypothetical protein [Amycolatopsis coloradensis]|nr:hypothetical protein [Amycolatopsis coloradensis]